MYAGNTRTCFSAGGRVAGIHEYVLNVHTESVWSLNTGFFSVPHHTAHNQGEFIFPDADGRIKTLGGDQQLRTSTLVRQRPTQGESNIDFLGESEGSLPPPHDSFPDAGEAINDFWSMSGNFIYRHHVEPRVKLHSPREESFPITLKYIDVSRTTHTNLDVKQEKRIDDYWNIDG